MICKMVIGFNYTSHTTRYSVQVRGPKTGSWPVFYPRPKTNDKYWCLNGNPSMGNDQEAGLGRA